MTLTSRSNAETILEHFLSRVTLSLSRNNCFSFYPIGFIFGTGYIQVRVQVACTFDLDYFQYGRLAAMFVPERARNNKSIAAKTKRYLDDSKVVLGRP